MNANPVKSLVGVVLLVVLALLTGCQTETEAPAVEPTETPEIVLAEGETVCEMSIDDWMLGLTREEPVYGEVTRGELQAGRMHCPGMLENAALFSLVTFIDEDGDPGAPLTFLAEYVPEDGGAWLGTGRLEGLDRPPTTLYATLEGDGELEGRQMEFVLQVENMTATYRIVQVAESPVAQTPEAADVVLAEGETVCDMSIDDSMPGLTREEPVYGEVTRGEAMAGRMNCPGMLDNAKAFSIVTLIDEDGVPGALNFLVEYVPEAGGAWFGTGHWEDSDGIVSEVVALEGDGELEGQRMEFSHQYETGATTYRIVQVAEP